MVGKSDDDESTVENEVSCLREMFSESKEVLDMISNIPNLCELGISQKEKAYEKYKFIFEQYIEQPHLLDPYIDEILANLLSLVKKDELPMEIKHEAFKYLNTVIKGRGYKVVVRHLPHEVSDFEQTLRLLEAQDPKDTGTWETRYCLLLWLSIIVMIPFHMARLDSGAQSTTVMDRLVKICQEYLMTADACRNAAAYLTARFLTRSDVKEVYLSSFLEWAVKKATEKSEDDKIWERFGPLASIAAVLKHGKREDLLPHAPQLLQSILAAKCQEDHYSLSSKYAMKIVTRIGLTFLKPRVASWRYSRGSRSLAINLSQGDNKVNGFGVTPPNSAETGAGDEDDDEDDQDVPPEIEEVIEELIQGLKNENSITRWSAAKGVGRVMSRLSKQCGDEVVCSVMDLLSPRYTDDAWHGGCLALAELAKRGLLLPSRLPEVVPLVTEALTYEEPHGYTSVGSNVRDAACYVCWAFARAYHPSVIQPYCTQIARALLVVACFDRQINCRRAAAAAFQENVGRLGNFPHGIDILTAADYFTVGVRQNAYTKISVFIAQFEDYTETLIDHLLERKVDHWDPAVRTLAAKALFNLTAFAPQYLASHGLQSLLSKTCSIDLNARHGAILALGEVLHALSLIDNLTIEPKYLEEVESLVPRLQEKQQLRGLSGDLTKMACCSFIDNCSRASLPFHGSPVVDVWRDLIDECLNNESVDMRQAAAIALGQLCTQYYAAEGEEMQQLRRDIVTKYTSRLPTVNKNTRMGYALALGCMPKLMLQGSVTTVVRVLVKCAQITPNTTEWADVRSAALRALTAICINVGLAKTDSEGSCYGLVVEIIEALLGGLADYTNDSRGDVGAWTREAGMLGLKEVLALAADEASELLAPHLVTSAFVEICGQAVEKIDRTRGYAGRVFSSLLHKEGKPVPHIPAEQRLREIFPQSVCEKCNWIAARDTFPLFVQLLSLPQFSKNVLLGLVFSVGGLTESLVKYSSQALFEYLRSQSTEELERLCDQVASLFEQWAHDDRVTVPMLTFLERLLNSNSIAPVVLNPQTTFTTRILRCAKAEIAKTANSKKILASVDFFCQLIQVPGEVSRRALVQIGILLCHRFLWLRRETATKLYESLMVYSDEVGVEPAALEQALALLSDTDWTNLTTEAARAQRNSLCTLLQIPTPRPCPK